MQPLILGRWSCQSGLTPLNSSFKTDIDSCVSQSMRISVYLSDHAVQRIDERILQTDLKIMEILEKMNHCSLNNGILVEPKHFVAREKGGESSKIYFPGLSFVLVVEKKSMHEFYAITLKNTLHPKIKGQKVEIMYSLQN